MHPNEPPWKSFGCRTEAVFEAPPTSWWLIDPSGKYRQFTHFGVKKCPTKSVENPPLSCFKETNHPCIYFRYLMLTFPTSFDVQNSLLTLLWPRDTARGDDTDSDHSPPVSMVSIFCRRLYLSRAQGSRGKHSNGEALRWICFFSNAHLTKNSPYRWHPQMPKFS